jgi:hypothetical protein
MDGQAQRANGTKETDNESINGFIFRACLDPKIFGKKFL